MGDNLSSIGKPQITLSKEAVSLTIAPEAAPT